MSVDRRGFLGAISAFAAAVASGVRMPTGVEAVSAPAAPPLKADAFAEAVESLPTYTATAASSLQDDLIAALKSWGVVGYCETTDAPGRLRRVSVEYRQGSFSIADRAYVDALVGKMRPVSIEMSCESLDITHWGSPYRRYKPGTYTVTVEYA